MRDEIRRVSVNYCEDIRHEITSQTSLIGIFNGSIQFQEFPASLPKLCFWVEIATPLTHLFQHLQIVFKTDAGQILLDQTVPKEALAGQKAAAESQDWSDEEEPTLSLRANFSVPPVSFDGPTKIRCRIYTELGEAKGPGLLVVKGHPFAPQIIAS